MTRRWREADPLVVDGALALLCTLVSLVTVILTESGDDPSLDGVAVLLILGQNVPVVWRRQHPVVAWFLAGVFSVTRGVGEFPDPVLDIGPLLIIYTVAAYTKRRTATILGLTTAAALVLGLVTAGDADARDVSFNVLVYSLAWILGEHQRSRRAQFEENARRAVAAERARIAHELHDVVAHHVSMMVVQAEGGASVVQTSPDRAAQAFDAIGSTGREAMNEMRRLLGALREEGASDAPSTAPQPGLDAVDALAERVRQSGLAVDVQREGPPRQLPTGIDLSAYRIVQEALTNTVRHAHATRASVVVRYLDGCVELEVADDGRGPSPGTPGDGPGHGLIGMRERVALFGGELRAGRREGGGFSVVARLPTTG